MKQEFTLNETWLHGKGKTSQGIDYEINVNIPYVGIGDDFYVQGDEAEDVIRSIYELYNKHNWTASECVSRYKLMYL